MEDILIGTTDRSILVFVPDAASTDGSGKTGLAHTGLTVSYTRVETDNDVVVTDVTSSLNALTNLTDAHNDWGWKEVSNTLAPGLYRLDIADAVYASGAWQAVVYVMVTTSAASAIPKGYRLVAVNALDAVRMGLTALPNAAADAAGGLPISDAGGLDLDAQVGTKINDILTDTGTTLQAELDGIQADTEDIQTRIPAALVGGRIDATVDGTGMEAAAVAAIADGVWDEATSGHTTAGTFGQREYIIRANTAQAGAGTTITLDASASATDDIYNNQILVVTAGTGAGQSRIISDYNGTTKVATVPTWQTNPSSDSVFVILPFGAIPGASAPTAAEVADAVWDEAQADHVTAGSFGITASEIADILVDTAEIGAAGAGLTALASAANLATVDTVVDGIQTDLSNATDGLGAIKADTAAILIDTAEIGAAGAGLTNINLPNQTMDIVGNITGNLSGSVGSVTGAVGSVTGAVGSVTGAVGSVTGAVGSVTGAVGSVTGNVGGNVTGSVGSLAAQAKADVNAEAVDALATDVIADSVPADGSRPTIAQALYLLTQFMTERAVSGTTMTVKKPDGSTTLLTLTLNDATTPTSITRAS